MIRTGVFCVRPLLVLFLPKLATPEEVLGGGVAAA